LKFDLDPTPTKAIVIAVLLFVEAIILPLQVYVLQEQTLPSGILIVGWFLTAIVQLITFLLAFVGYEQKES